MAGYKPEMTPAERENRVLDQMATNAIRSRQSGTEWTEALNAYRAWLTERSPEES